MEVRGWPRWMRDSVREHPACEHFGVERVLGPEELVLARDSVECVTVDGPLDEEARKHASARLRWCVGHVSPETPFLVLTDGFDADGTVHRERIMLSRLGLSETASRMLREERCASDGEDDLGVAEEEAEERCASDGDLGVAEEKAEEGVAEEALGTPSMREPSAPATPVRVPSTPTTPTRQPSTPTAPVSVPSMSATPVREPSTPTTSARQPPTPTAPARQPPTPTAPARTPTPVTLPPPDEFVTRMTSYIQRGNDTPDWLRAPPPSDPVTRIVLDDATVVALVGTIPPNLLTHLAGQQATLLTTDGQRVSAYRVGPRVRVGKHAVDTDSYAEGAYHAFASPSSSSLPPLRRVGGALRAHRIRRNEFERR